MTHGHGRIYNFALGKAAILFARYMASCHGTARGRCLVSVRAPEQDIYIYMQCCNVSCHPHFPGGRGGEDPFGVGPFWRGPDSGPGPAGSNIIVSFPFLPFPLLSSYKYDDIFMSCSIFMC